MTNNALIAVVLDRSGSMESIRADTIGGFNAFLEEQKKVEGTCLLTLAQFDTQYDMLYHNLPLEDIKPLTRETFVPRGGTALLDAVGRTLNVLEEDLLGLERSPEGRPQKIYFVVITDGEENSSQEFTRDQIFKMIADRRQNSAWEFIFLAANQDAIQVSKTYGFTASSTMDYTGNSTPQAYNALGASVASSRTTGTRHGFTSEQRNSAMGH